MSLKKYTEGGLVIAALLCLSSCDSLPNPFSNQNHRTIPSFTPLVKTEASNTKITIPVAKSLMNWEDINSVNNQTNNLKLADISSGSAQHTLKGLGDVKSPPIIVDKKLYLLNNGILRTYNLENFVLEHTLYLGEGKKKYDGGGITHDRGLLYITDGTFKITVFDTITKQIVASKVMPDIMKVPPVIAANKLIVLTISNQIFALDKKTLKTQWLYQGTPEVLSEQNTTLPIIYERQVLVALSSGELISLDLDQGVVQWSKDLSSSNIDLLDLIPINTVSQIITDNGYAYLANASGGITKVDMRSGQVLWQKVVQDVQNINKLGNIIVGITNAKQVVALEALSGRIVWVQELSASKDGKKVDGKPTEFMTPILVNGRLVLVSSAGQLYQLDPVHGNILQQMPIGDKVKAIAADQDYFYTVSNKKLTVFGRR